jgi:hypothetical protein
LPATATQKPPFLTASTPIGAPVAGLGAGIGKTAEPTVDIDAGCDRRDLIRRDIVPERASVRQVEVSTAKLRFHDAWVCAQKENSPLKLERAHARKRCRAAFGHVPQATLLAFLIGGREMMRCR